MFSRDGSRLPSIYADGRSFDDVIAFEDHATAWQSVSICVIYHRIAMTVAVHITEPMLQHFDDA